MSLYHVTRTGAGATTFCVNSGPGIPREHENPGIWPSFEAAAKFAAEWNTRYGPDGYFYRVVMVGAEPEKEGWRDREDRRFAIGEYKQTPWHYESWYAAKHEDHFCHLSVKEPGMVAFTENAAKGEADRQTQQRAGRYLTKFFADVLSPDEIATWANKVSAIAKAGELKVTQDADEIEDVYLEGPSSCMSYHVSSYNSPVHPTRVYAGPDTALAYLGTREAATARCVVWPEKLIYTRVYPHSGPERQALVDALEAAGYRMGNLSGARIRRIRHNGAYVVPYIDCGDDLSDDGEYLVMDGGCIQSTSTTGLSEEGWTCPNCEETADEDNASYINDVEETWCGNCTDNDAQQCHHDDNYYSTRLTTFVEVNITRPYVWNSRGYTYQVCIAEDNLDSYGAVYVDDRGEYWSSDETFYCEDTSQYWHNDDAFDWDGETISYQAAETRMGEQTAEDDPVAHVAAWRARFSDGPAPDWDALIGTVVSLRPDYTLPALAA